MTRDNVMDILRSIPDLGIRHRAIVNRCCFLRATPGFVHDPNYRLTSVRHAINSAFPFSESIEGAEYWLNVLELMK